MNTNTSHLSASRHFLLVAAISPMGAASATDLSSTFQVASGVAGQAMFQVIGDVTYSIVNLLVGAAMYIFMAWGAALALYGFGRGNKETLMTGVILFVLATVIRFT